MKRCLLIACFLFLSFQHAFTQEKSLDTVHVGIYVTSIHNIDFKQNEYAITFWLWLNYKNPALDFVNNLEIPNAKSVEKTFFTMDTSGGNNSLLMKMQCVMKDSWKISNFPFDRQTLRLSLENSQYDASSMIFIPDTLGEHFDKKFTLRGWSIDSCVLSASNTTYKTAFGNQSATSQESVYSSFKLWMSISRETAGLFWKMFLGMYLAFLIAFICFYIHSDGMDSRFGLSVGALFAVIGNKYIIDSSLPESSSFTLVDMLHGITLFFILVVISANAYSLKMIKRNRIEEAVRFDNIMAAIVLTVYLLSNGWFIWNAVSSN